MTESRGLDDSGSRPGGGRSFRRVVTDLLDRVGLPRRMSFVFLLASLALAGAGAFEAWRAMQSHQATAEGLLRDYGAFAAWTFEQRSRERLGGGLSYAFEPVKSAGPACTPGLLLAHKDQSPSCACGAGLIGRYTFKIPLFEDPSDIDFAGDVPDQEQREAVRKLILSAVETHPENAGRLGLIHPVLGGRPTTLAYFVADFSNYDQLPPAARTRLPAADTPRDTIIFGFEVDREGMSELLARVADNHDLLPPSLHGAEDQAELLSLAVRDRHGETLFATAEMPEPEMATDQPLHELFGGLVAQAAVKPDAADALIIGGLPRSRMPYLLGLFALAGAMALVALGQLRREQELAGLRSDFVASVSHELRTPLAQMRLFIETLRLGRTRNAEESEWALENIDRETLRLSHLVENVLQFSRSERGARSGKMELVDLSREVRQVEESFALLASSRRRTRATLVNQVPEGLTAQVHPESFRQVVLNFLDNAVKYGPPGQTVTLTGERSNGSVRLAVDDQGPGVEAEERDKIWKPFRRGRNAVGSVAVGSGIGLSVAREIAQRHGGSTWVEDSPAGGARFVIELPWSDGSIPEAPAD